MWLILEGIDGAGKTRLAEHVRDAYPGANWIIEHVTRETGGFEDLANLWRNYPRSENVIWDRAHLGELVYGTRGPVTQAQVNVWEALLADRGAALVLVWRDPADAARDKPTWPFPELVRHASRFADLEGDKTLDDVVTRLPLQRLGPTEVEEFLVKRTAEALGKPAEREEQADAEGIGARTPLTWILGQERNPRATCHAPLASPSGMRLTWPHVNPLYVRVSNARGWGDPDGSRLRERWEGLDEPSVICLGTVARDLCRRARVPVVADVAHPQYVARFEPWRAERYADEFRCLIGYATASRLGGQVDAFTERLLGAIDALGTAFKPTN